MKTVGASINPRKKEAVTQLKTQLNVFNDVVFFDYRGFSTQELTNLRHLLSDKGAVLKIIQNNILLRTLTSPEFKSIFKNPTAVVFCPKESASQIAKMLLAFFKENKKADLLPKGAFADSSVWLASQMDAFSKLPSRSELIAQLLATMKEPVNKFARGLKAIEDKKNEQN